MAAISGACFTACGRTRDFAEPNEACETPACACLCHEPPGGRR